MKFSCGFYKELEGLRRSEPSSNFGFLGNVRVTGESSAYNFLHGCCDEFAAMLSDAFGYEIECVRNADHRLIHAYCTSYIGSERAYIDIRGITTDSELFFSEFENELTYYSPTDSILVLDEDGCEVETEREVWVNKDELFDGEYEHWDDPEISAFIKDYGDYYDSDRYISIYRCKACKAEFEEIDDEDVNWFEYCGEEDLWGHIQLDHPELYMECQNLETPDMLDIYYDHIIERKDLEIARFESPIDKSVNKSRSLDSVILDARGAIDSRKDLNKSGSSAPEAPANKLPNMISR